MRFNSLQTISLWIDNLLRYEGCDSKTLMLRRHNWIMCMATFFPVCFLTFGFLIFTPQLTLLISYGLILIGIYLVYFVAAPFIRGTTMKLMFTCHVLFILVTFAFIMLLGGIANSAGLIFVGLSAVLFSIPFQNRKYSIAVFIIYTFTIMVSGILQPLLTVPEQMTPALNALIYMINILWMSAALLWVIISFITQRVRLEQIEAQRIRDLDEAKTRLFTSITHEFRTPLTVINGMADLIRADPDQWIETGTEKIKTNSNILLRLVNQMLDLARMDASAMPVNLLQGDIKNYLASLVELFRSAAVIRRLGLEFTSDRHPVIMDFDPDKLMPIISNLISNALKFTPAGGLIEVSANLSEDGRVFEIRVKDTGTGIDPEHLPHLFDRFYQAGARNHASGTGLGLALTRELVCLLKGSINLKSIPGAGSEFVVSLPVSHTARPLTDQDVPDFNSGKEIMALQEQMPDEPAVSDQADGDSRPVLLIVEDNRDVVQFLFAILNHEYRVEVAPNGRIGLDRALELVPDIVLSDVMMPEMDGIELLENLKRDFRTSHIPVVMLTAKADMGSRLAGLERGADAYLAKPFDKTELLIQLGNLVELRKSLYERYRSPWPLGETSDPSILKEDEFMFKVRSVLEANLEDDEYGVTQLCHELAMSRSQLYRKFKSLSNATIGEYFKALRLHRAHSLLTTTQLNITQIAFAVGFKNLSHFSREFTREFDRNPSDFRRSEG